MSTQDKLPPLPEPFDNDRYFVGPHEQRFDLFTADQMRAYARAALAAQESEPVAWQSRIFLGGKWERWQACEPPEDPNEREVLLAGKVAYQLRPLYAAPPAREAVALTEEQVDVLARPCYSTYGGFDISAFARAVERAVWQANNLREPT